MSRKDEHIDLAMQKQSASARNGFDDFALEPFALTELNIDAIDASTAFLDLKCSVPLFISSMTGGAAAAEKINTKLAKAANEYRIPFCTGSMSPLLKGQDVKSDYDLKKLLPDTLFFLNVSVLTIRAETKHKGALEWLEKLSADGLVIHLNVLQELIQPEGERDFKGSIDAIDKIRNAYKGRIIVKEVGVGIDVNSANILKRIGIDAIEVSGQGGTSWSWIEGQRAGDIRGETFKNFGIPTPLILQDLRGINIPIIGSGGVRNGLDVAKVLALGGNLAGLARVLLKAAMEESEQSVVNTLSTLQKEVKTAMLVCGAKNIAELSRIKNRQTRAV